MADDTIESDEEIGSSMMSPLSSAPCTPVPSGDIHDYSASADTSADDATATASTADDNSDAGYAHLVRCEYKSTTTVLPFKHD